VGRPAIGITIAYDLERPGRFALRKDYVRAVERAGGLPLVIAPGQAAEAPEFLAGVKGLVLTGGSDVDPSLYGDELHEATKNVIRERDEFELALCNEALRRDMPVLAICRGHQVLNVATGGTLIQDIPSQLVGAMNHDPEKERWEMAHRIRILPGTRLHEILGADTVLVNSFHHQAVREPGQGFVVSARSDEDDLIEGIEDPSRRFVVGVQWHPEAFWNREPNFEPLFRSLVSAGSKS